MRIIPVSRNLNPKNYELAKNPLSRSSQHLFSSSCLDSSGSVILLMACIRKCLLFSGPKQTLATDFGWLIFGHIVMAFFLTLLCAKFVPAGGAGRTAGLGILVALVKIGSDFIFYAVQPLTTKILFGWIVGDLIMFGIAGVIIGAIYKPSSPTTT